MWMICAFLAPFFSCWGSSSDSGEADGSWRDAVHPKQVNESLYELKEPLIAPNMVILFFHGFYSTDSENAHFSTWQSEDGSSVWPDAWLVEKFPSARILYVSYKACLEKSHSGADFDMYTIVENLVSDLLMAKIGQTPNCPVILVGYCFGGLVIKQLCLYMNNRKISARQPRERTRLESFLRSIKGVFYYGTPHNGIPCIRNSVPPKGSPLLKYFIALNQDAGHLSFDFSRLWKNNAHWMIHGLGELLPTNWANAIGDQCQGLPKYPRDLERRAKVCMEKLKDCPVVAIFGMGGIGKTTLAKQVYNSTSKDFEYTCFVDNVKSKYLNDTLTGYLLENFHQHRTRVQRIHWLDLKKKKTLIVMDDVDFEDQLSVLPKLHDLGSGSRLIITTRDRGILNVYENCEVHEVEFLDGGDARKLFCQNAFGGQEEIPSYATHLHHLLTNVTSVVDKCDGLPLTLEVLGRYLGDYVSDATVWEETIDRLGQAYAICGGRNDRVWASLKVSYDALLPGEQEMFVEAATYFSEKPLEEALAAWSTSTRSSRTTWANLVNRSMVKVLSVSIHDWDFGTRYDIKQVWVHEQLRDLAVSLAQGVIQYEDEEASDWLDLLNANQMKEDTKILKLRDAPDESVIQADRLVNLDNLKYLDLDTTVRCAPCDRARNNFGKKLCILKWPILQPRDMFPVSLKSMRNLTVLELRDWDLSGGLVEELCNLANLRILTLSSVAGLGRLPENFGNLSSLKMLNLDGNPGLRLPKSFGNLSALEDLFLRGLDCADLPESLGDLSSLITLKIMNCGELASLPSSFGSNLPSLKQVFIQNCPLLDALPEAFSQLSGLQHLEIIGCRGLKGLSDSFGNLHALQILKLVSTGIKTLPTGLCLLSALNELLLENPGPLEMLPDNFGQLSALKDLKLLKSNLVTLPESFGLLASLEILFIQQCHNLAKLPESVGELARLRDLILDVDSVKALPDSLRGLSALKLLSIKAKSLESLPTSFGRMSSLQELRLTACNELQKLPDSFGDLSSLQTLRISSERLGTLPESLGKLRSLHHLELATGSLRTLPESVGQLPLLEAIEFCCDGHERMPTNFNLLQGSSLVLWGNETRILPEGLGSCRSLEQLTFKIMPNLERLPDELGNLPSLRKLTINWCGQLKSIPDSLRHISSLHKIKVVGCSNLKSIPDSWGWACPSQAQGGTGGQLTHLDLDLSPRQ